MGRVSSGSGEAVAHARTPRRTSLSKSRYTLGLRCHRRLWWTVNEPDAPELAVGPELQAVFDRGHLVGELARDRFPGGTLIDLDPWKLRERVAATEAAMAQGALTIHEASFLADDGFVAVDVLHREHVRSDWTLTEVKSTLSVKAEHIADAAVQTHVVRAAGIPVSRVEVMHLNPACRHPDLSNLFRRVDVTAQVESSLLAVPAEVRRQLAVIQAPEPPVVATGPHCSEPWECPFMDRCHPPEPAHSIATLRGGRQQRDALRARGFRTVLELPEDEPLAEVADRQRRAVQSGRVVVEPGLAAALDALEAPIAHLDFETVAPPVPAWPGCSPFGAVPVQFSVRVEGPGQAQEVSWLAPEREDPRPAIARALIAALPPSGTILAYNASFEAARIRDLAAAVPELAEPLLAIEARLVDLLPIVRSHVYHPDFGGGFGLKVVAPALVPGPTYDDLAIPDGALASNALEGLLARGEPTDPTERAELRKNLLSYCAQDTLATVLVLARLRELAHIPGYAL